MVFEDGWMTRQIAVLTEKSRCVKWRVKDEGTPGVTNR